MSNAFEATATHVKCRAEDGVELHAIHWSSSSLDTNAEVPPLVLLHGGGANAHWWDHLAPRFARSRPVIALDFRGHGDSEYPRERVVGAFNLDLEALVAWIGTECIDLVGHSMGAAVALDHASRFEATHSLVLLDLSRGATRGSGRRARLALSLRRTYRSREEAIARYRFLPESAVASEELRSAIAAHSVRAEPDGRFGYKFDPGWFGLPSKPRPELANVRCPALLVRGEQSGLLTSDSAEEFVEALPDGRLAVIPDAGHHVFLDQPEDVFDHVASFLDAPRDPDNRP